MSSDVVRTYRYRLRLSADQSAKMAQFAGVARFIYNIALEQRAKWNRQFRAATGASISFASQCRELKALRADADWIEAAPHCALSQALRDLDAAYSRFFKGKTGYPSPRRKGVNDSFRIPGKEIWSPIRGCATPRFAEIRLPKIGWCQFRLSRPLPSGFKLLQVTVALDALGWHICLNLRVAAPAPLGLAGAVGVDRGVASTLACSDGSFASQPVAAMRVLLRRAKAHQKRMARQQRGSSRRAVTRRLLAKAQAKAARIRKHWNHEQTTRLAATYGTVVIEALKTASMTRSAKGTAEAPGVNVRQKAGLNRSILEHGWHQFETLLAYKMEAAGGALIKVAPAYTSQTCFDCGSISKEHRKSQAAFICSDCGYSAHADTNAALNIKRAGEQPASRGSLVPSLKREPTLENSR